MGDSTSPVVSVIVPTRNRAASLAATLSAIAAQTFQAFEVLVIDDGSDASALAEYDRIWSRLDDRFLLSRPSVPGGNGTGPAAARNRGLTRARGEFVAFCDDDDRWRLPDHLESAVRVLKEQDADFFFANLRGENQNGEVVVPDWFFGSTRLTAGRRVLDRPAVHELSLRSAMSVFRNYYPSLDSCVVRRKLLDTIGLMWERVHMAEDLDFIFRMVDGARRIVYRPDCTVAVACYPRPHVCAQNSKLEAHLQTVLAYQHLRLHCQTGTVRRLARAGESWLYREFACELAQRGRHGASFSMAWQAFAINPGPGTLRALFAAVGRAAMALLSPGRPRQQGRTGIAPADQSPRHPPELATASAKP
jgi:GT2 family glycosyltransferase